MKIKKGDTVIVTVGEEKTKTPRRVISVVANGAKLVVEGINQVYKHVKRGHPKSPQGGRLRMEMPISSANVMYYCSKCNKGVRLGMKKQADGSKERICRKCGTSAGRVSPARVRSN